MSHKLKKKKKLVIYNLLQVFFNSRYAETSKKTYIKQYVHYAMHSSLEM